MSVNAIRRARTNAQRTGSQLGAVIATTAAALTVGGAAATRAAAGSTAARPAGSPTAARNGNSAGPANGGPAQTSAANGNSAAPRDGVTLSREAGEEQLFNRTQMRFSSWDGDRDGHLTEQEVEGALRNNRDLSVEDRATLETLRGRQSELEEASNDEWFDEDDGFTRADLDAFRNAGDGEAARLGEQYGIEHGLATEPQSVRETASANGPADLTHRIGSRDYYIERYRDFRRRNPNERAPDYYLNYGLKYYDRFHANMDSLQPTSQAWVERTGVALQRNMEARRTQGDYAGLERNQDDFRSFAYGSHPDAYVNSGLHDVPWADRVTIGLTPDAGDLLSWDGISQMLQTGVRVLAQDVGLTEAPTF